MITTKPKSSPNSNFCAIFKNSWAVQADATEFVSVYIIWAPKFNLGLDFGLVLIIPLHTASLYPCTWTFSTLQWQKRFKVHTFSIFIYRLWSMEILMLSFLFMGQALPTRTMKNGWRSSNLTKVMKMKSSNEINVTSLETNASNPAQCF